MPFVLCLAQNPHPSGSKKNISLRSELRRARDVSVLIFPPVSTVNVSVLVKKCLVEHNLKSKPASAAAAEGEDCCSEKSSEAETKMEQRLQISMGMAPSPSPLLCPFSRCALAARIDSIA